MAVASEMPEITGNVGGGRQLCILSVQIGNTELIIQVFGLLQSNFTNTGELVCVCVVANPVLQEIRMINSPNFSHKYFGTHFLLVNKYEIISFQNDPSVQLFNLKNLVGKLMTAGILGNFPLIDNNSKGKFLHISGTMEGFERLFLLFNFKCSLRIIFQF